MPSIDIVDNNRIAGTASPLEMSDANGVVYRLIPQTNGTIKVQKSGVDVVFPVARPVIAKTADYTVKVSDAGAIFTTTGAAGAVTFTLPAVASSAGLEFEFVNTVGQTMTVAAPAGTLVTFNNAAATSVAWSTAGNLIQGGCRVFCDGAKWIVRPAGAGTMTVA